jgi:hypothetical protein
MTASLSTIIAAPHNQHAPNGIAKITNSGADGRALRGAAKVAWAAWVAQVKLFEQGLGADPGPFSYSGLNYSTAIGPTGAADGVTFSAAGTISKPTGFTLTPPFTITRASDMSITHNFDIDAVKPTFTNTIYCGPGGTDTNTGLTYALRVRSLKQAIAKAIALSDTIIRIYAVPTTYYFNDVVSTIQASFADFGTITAGKTIVIEPNYVDNGSFTSGNIVSVHNVTMPSFVATADPNIYVSTYTTESVAAVAIDLATLNGEGNPTLLRRVNVTPASSAAPWPEINAKWQSGVCGALWLDSTNKKLYVRLPNNRAPDSNLKVMSAAGTGNFRITAASSSVTVWMKNVECWGGNAIRLISGATGNITMYTKDCAMRYSTGNAFTFQSGPGTIYHVRMQSYDHGQDGFNYNGIAGSSASCPVFYELSCTAKRCGLNSDVDNSNNGSSCHVNCRGVRINGIYEATNRVIHDIQDSQSWNLKITAGPSLITTTGAAAANFAAGLTGFTGTCTVWLDNCTSAAGSNYGAEVYAGGTIKYANMVLPSALTLNDGTGTLTTYTP